MSRIYFHSESGTAEVLGRERANMGRICGEMLVLALGPFLDWRNERAWQRKLVPAGHYLHSTDHDFEGAFSTWVRNAFDTFMIGDRKIDIFTTALNTTLVAGNDAMRLLARLHGQCEIHAYVEGQNRAWLADTIEDGRQRNILRSNAGWEDAVTLLRADDAEPVVTSYSVTESFPNGGIAVDGGAWEWPLGENGEPDGDAFYELSNSERWRLALQGLRTENERRKLEMRPENWSVYLFDEGIHGFMLFDMLHEDTA